MNQIDFTQFEQYSGLNAYDVRVILDLNSRLEKLEQQPSGKLSPAEGEKGELLCFKTKEIRKMWYCYCTVHGYDYSFCSDNEYHSIELAKRIMGNNGWLLECEFPDSLLAEPSPSNEPADPIFEQVKHIYSDCTTPEIRKKAVGEMEIFLLDLHKRIHDEAFEKSNGPIKVPDTNVGDIPQSVVNEPIKEEKPSVLELTEAEIMVIQERRRQVQKEGFTKEHDATHTNGELAAAAGCYALAYWSRTDAERLWPFEKEWFKTVYEGYVYTSDRINNLKKAGALIIAEIERLMPTKQVSEPASGKRTVSEVFVSGRRYIEESEIAALKEQLEQKDRVSDFWRELSITHLNHRCQLEKELAELKGKGEVQWPTKEQSQVFFERFLDDESQMYAAQETFEWLKQRQLKP